MATHPYISGPGNIAQMILQLRKSFPGTVTAETVKKLGLAPNNESYVINALQFIGLIDSDNKKTSVASQVFSNHKDEQFAAAFEELVKKAYSALFELHGDHSWSLSLEDLITFFRQSDQTSDAIGRRQAKTFQVFAALAGHGETPAPKPAKAKGTNASSKKKGVKETKPPAANSPKPPPPPPPASKDFGLSVRIEINLPADGTKETYDDIFKSIRENLLNE